MEGVKQEGYLPLETFVKQSFYVLYPTDSLKNNWHISVLCNVMEAVSSGSIKRLIICMPPRYLKSVCISTAFPAWLIGMKQTSKIIVASYAMPLAEKLSIDTRNLMESDWYRSVFPNVVWDKSVYAKRKFATKQGGFRLATSVCGSLTGEGGDILIADDPQKPLDCMNKKYRDKTYNWFVNTFLSRLNSKKKGAVILVMQRLHVDDLVGRITEGEIGDGLVQYCNGWIVLNFAAIAKEDESFRKEKGVLNEKMENIEILNSIRNQMGENVFDAQYQQSPKSIGGGLLRKHQVHFTLQKVSVEDGIFVSVDTAFKCGANNDYTAITMWVVHGQHIIMFDSIHRKMEFNNITEMLCELFCKYNIHKMLIEDKGSGTSIIQNLKPKYGAKIESIKPTLSKEVRFASIIHYFEDSTVKIHENIHDDVISQILEFPYGKHDDIVDSVSQFVQWFMGVKRKQITVPSIRMI